MRAVPALQPPTRLDRGAVRLERVRPGHAAGITTAINASHAELLAFMDWMTPEPRTAAQTDEFIEICRREWEAGEAFTYVMLDPVEVEVIGVCGLMTRPGPRRLEVGYWVRTDRTGEGIATAAATLLTEAGLALPGIDVIEIHNDAANVASGRVAEKLGYVEVVRREVEIDTPGECGVEVIWELSRAAQP